MKKVLVSQEVKVIIVGVGVNKVNIVGVNKVNKVKVNKVNKDILRIIIGNLEEEIITLGDVTITIIGIDLHHLKTHRYLLVIYRIVLPKTNWRICLKNLGQFNS